MVWEIEHEGKHNDEGWECKTTGAQCFNRRRAAELFSTTVAQITVTDK